MNLFTPTDTRPVHFVGIGGAGMSALALIACRRGVVVSGCDTDPSGAADLAAMGARIWQGHDPSHLAGARAVVVTAAVPPGHPELDHARALGLPVVPRKEALAALIGSSRSVAVSGTHGKTTTTVMTTEALTAAGLAPTGIAGGRVSAWGGNARLAGDDLFVVEADEYDQAFLTLHPTVAIINNVEPDHLECYGSMTALEAAFVEFGSRADTAVVSADDPGARLIGGRLPRSPRLFGCAADADVRIADVVQHADRTEATVRWKGGRTLPIRLRVPGVHNLRNAVAALAATEAIGGDVTRAAGALADFNGVGRRFERLGEHGGVAVVDDYAHHPSELVATLAAARQAYPGRRLVAVFQPHLYSRTAAHGRAMGEALAAADLVVVTEVYAAREQPMDGVSGRQVAEAAQRAGADARFEPARADVGRHVFEVLAPGDVVLTLGAGDITRVGPELVRWLDAA
jgi:UDP-N-acetylmuramate--alanine ligase